MTTTMFAVPIGTALISQSTCDKIKPLKGITQLNANDDDFDVLKDYPEIKQELTNSFVEWITELLRVKANWVMTTSWITENSTGREMTRHSHKNCAYSGVLYFDKVDDSHAPLIFENPLEPFTTLFPQNLQTNCNEYNTDQFVVTPEETRMIFFPSYLFHKHHAYTPTSIPRRSLACNFFPIGKYGHHDSTLDTNWLKHGI